MNLNQLIEDIDKSNAQNIKVSKVSLRHGNRDGNGDSSMITLDLDGERYTFTNKSGTWEIMN